MRDVGPTTELRWSSISDAEKFEIIFSCSTHLERSCLAEYIGYYNILGNSVLPAIMLPPGLLSVRFCVLWMILICPRCILSTDVNYLLPEADGEAAEYLPLPDSNDHGLLNSYANIDEDIGQRELYQSDDRVQDLAESAAKAFPDESSLALDHAYSITSDGKKEREVDQIWKPDSNSKQSEEDMLKTLLADYEDTE